MNLASLNTTQREAIIAVVAHGALRRTREGYRPSQPGLHAMHSTRACAALIRAGLAVWTDGETEVQPTAAGRALVRDGATAAHGGRIERSLAA